MTKGKAIIQIMTACINNKHFLMAFSVLTYQFHLIKNLLRKNIKKINILE